MVGAVDVEQRAQRSLVRKVCVALVASGLALVLVSRSWDESPTTPQAPAVAPIASR